MARMGEGKNAYRGLGRRVQAVDRRVILKRILKVGGISWVW